MKAVTKLTEKQQVEFALNQCDENCRSIIECACVPTKREKTIALYKYNVKDFDKLMKKDVKDALVYLRSRGNALPFKMSEKEEFVWFDKKKE